MLRSLALGVFLCSLCACDPDGPSRHEPGELPEDTARDTGGDTGQPPIEGCRAEPGAADRDRLVMVSYPYGASGAQARAWGVFTLSRDGELRDTGTRVDMGRGYDGHVAFTPDGSVGMVAQDDGSLGVFEALGADEVRVVHERLEGPFYASAVVSDPTGEWAFIVDGNWAENGGGLYRASIDCDTGELGPAERVVEAKLPAWYGTLHHDPGRALLVGREAGGASAGEDAFLLEAGELPSLLGGADLFGDDEAIFAGVALSFDDATLLVGDNAGFSSVPNRIAVAAVGEGGLEPLQILPAVDDPVDIVASPYNDKALVLSGFSDALFELDYQPGAAEPYTLRGEPAYVGAGPALPTAAAMVSRGPLKGLVLITENQGVRRVRFGPGEVQDLGLGSFGSGLDFIPGAIGVQP